ncbi:phospholipase-like protein [Tanacetum coccineum]
MLGCQVECLDGETEIVPLSYHLGHDIQIQFGREEFCLLTGLRFGVDYSDVYEDSLIPYRRRVCYSTKDGKPKGFYRINDHDAVSLYCIAILQLVLLGFEARHRLCLSTSVLERLGATSDKRYWLPLLLTAPTYCSCYCYCLLLLLRVAKHNHNVPDWILRNVNVKHWQPLYATEPEEDDDDHNSYSSMVFTWAFKEQDRVLKELLQKDAAREQMYHKMNKFMEELQVGRMPQAKKGPVIIGQHYGLSDLRGFQNTQGGPTFSTQASTSFFEGAQATPSYDHHTSSRYPYSHPATPNWNKGRNANVAPFKLGNAFVDDNEVDGEVIITGVRDTDDYIVYENVDPSKMYMPINAGGDHWVTGAINLPNSRFYVFDSLHSEVRMSTLYDHIRN